MRRVTVEVGKKGEEAKPLWCPMVYEFLSDFFYTCGLIGHIDRACTKKLQQGEQQLFSKTLHYMPEKRRMEEFSSDRTIGSHPTWRQGGSGSRGSWGSGSRGWNSGSGSDAPY
jgi:hypothetical protein